MNPSESATKPKRTRNKKPPRSSASGNGAGARHKKKRDLTAQELALELRELRANLDELTEQFRLRLGGQLVEVQRAVEGVGVASTTKRLPGKTIETMLSAVRQQKIKPRKGRAKDLVKLQKLLASLSALLPAEH